MNKKTLLVAFFALLAVSSTCFASREYQVGVSPLVLDLGEIERGREIVSEFFIVTASTEELLVKLEARRGPPEFFEKPAYSGLVQEYSEEDSSSWLLFPSNPVVLAPQEEALSTPGGTIRGWRKINFVVKIPDGAEPGYHLVSIQPSPYVSPGKALGVNIVAISAVNLLFRVPGEAVRSGQVLDVAAGKYDGKEAVAGVFFKNTGTVTVSAQAQNAVLYGGNSTLSGPKSSGIYYVPAQATQNIDVLFSSENIPAGTYEFFSEVHYITGKDELAADVTFKEKEKATSAVSMERAPAQSMAGWLFMIPVLLFFAVLYWRRKEPRKS